MRYGWNVFGNLYRRAKDVIIGKASSRVLTFLRDFVRDFIRDLDLRILFKSCLALYCTAKGNLQHIFQDVEKQESSSHSQKEKRRVRARARVKEIVKVGVSFSLTCFSHFPSVFPPWIFGFCLIHCKSAFLVSKWPSLQISQDFFLDKYGFFNEDSFFPRIL